jgi:chromosome partitioning protein
MRRIAIINQKGGVGKTTTTVNLSAALAAAGHRVCVLDLDPQGHATTHLGVEGAMPSLYDVLVKNVPLATVRRRIEPRLDLVPAIIDLAAAEVELSGVVGREVILREALIADPEPFDFILADCGPSLGVLTVNALAAVDEVLIPLQPHFFSLHGLGKLLETTALVARRINPSLKVAGVVVCLYDSSTRLAQEVIADVKEFFDRSRGANVPWADARVFDTRIRRNVKLAECPSHGKSIFGYAPTCPGAIDYTALANELVGSVDVAGEPVTADRLCTITS